MDVRDPLLQAVMDAQPDWVWVVGPDNRLQAVNEAMLRALGRRREEMLGERAERFVQVAPSPDSRYASEDDWLIATGQDVRGTERLGRLPDGRYVWWQRWKYILRDPATGAVTGLVGITRDITEQRELERAALEVADHERWRLGSELHDGAGGALAGIDMMLTALQTRLDREGRDTGELGHITQLLRATMLELKGIARGLAPVDLDQAGLYESLRRMLEQVQAARGVSCELTGDSAPQALLGAGDATHLYRIAQEAVSNAIQHGGARRLGVTLTQDERFVEIQVDDDGRGFDPAAEPAGLGLRLMNYRTRLMGGRFGISRRAQGGMCVRCWVPTQASVARITAAPGRT
ncbi:MAG: PAS domain-containing protein [Steroidobacteraceae bacterium]|jgi:two-component system CheB/CheR fusion protein|nr:PAS domain-containing protein [Steroidobacteraceae bacterium]